MRSQGAELMVASHNQSSVEKAVEAMYRLRLPTHAGGCCCSVCVCLAGRITRSCLVMRMGKSRWACLVGPGCMLGVAVVCVGTHVVGLQCYAWMCGAGVGV